MYDKIEKINNSQIQHGKYNDRIYLMKYSSEDEKIIIDELNRISSENNYSKIFAKVKKKDADIFLNDGFNIEAEVPSFYNGEDDGLFLGKFLDKARQTLKSLKIEEIAQNIKLAEDKFNKKNEKVLSDKYYIRKVEKKDADKLAELYKIVFATYPFPIHDPEFLISTMDDNVEYFAVFDKENDNIISASSAEKYEEYSNVEMTDFATLPEYLGNSYAQFLLDHMEQVIGEQGFKNLYTIARSHSAGMNITFSKRGYYLAGTLINNTNIFGQIESMNVWYKNL